MDIEALKDAANKAQRERIRAEREVDDMAKAAADQVRKLNAGRLLELGHAADAALAAYNHVASLAASHPWEGKKVWRKKWSHSSKEFGVVEVRRLDTKFAEHTPDWRMPGMGKPFVRGLLKSGRPALKVLHYGENINGVALSGWQLVDDAQGDTK
jgi:hypothetical protein